MRYMMFIKHPGDYDVRDVPPALFGAMGQLVEEYTRNGTFIDGAGLQPLAKGTRVRLADGKISVTDGPFAEAKEVVGGYALIEAKTHAEAVALATKFMELHRTHWPDFEGESEIRPLEAQLADDLATSAPSVGPRLPDGNRILPFVEGASGGEGAGRTRRLGTEASWQGLSEHAPRAFER